MGGVTDGPTVIKYLKSVFPRNASRTGGKCQLQTDSIVFRLITKFTPTLLLILAGLTFWQRMNNQHINCYAPPEEDIRFQAVNQYCFITGTYTIVEENVTKVDSKIRGGIRQNLPYPGVGPSKPSSEVKYHLYFQWVPFVLLIQAILLAFPAYVWKEALKGTLNRYCEVIMSYNGSEDEKKSLSISAKRFLRNTQFHQSFSKRILFREVIVTASVLISFFINDRLITGQFLDLGKVWINYLIHGNDSNGTNPLDIIFPKMSKCEFKKFGPGGSVITYDLLCVLTLNVIHDKVFLVQWFWFCFLLLLQGVTMALRCVMWLQSNLRFRLIWKRVDNSFFEDDAVDATEQDIEISDYHHFKIPCSKFVKSRSFGDWVTLHAIANSVDTLKFTKFLNSIIQFCYTKRNSGPGHKPEVNEYEMSPLKRASDRLRSENIYVDNPRLNNYGDMVRGNFQGRQSAVSLNPNNTTTGMPPFQSQTSILHEEQPLITQNRPRLSMEVPDGGVAL